MALIKCPECSGQVSDKATVCIHCGYPLQDYKSQNTIKLNTTKSNITKSKFYANIDGCNYDLTDLKEMFQTYSIEDQKAIYQYCEDSYKNTPKSYNYQELKNNNYRGLDLIQFIKETLKWPDVKAYLTYKFISECYRRNFNSFSFDTNKYDPEREFFKPQPSPASQNVVRCPKCGSTSVTTEEQGYGLFGWIGASGRKNLCQKCGYKWWPGR